MMTHFTPNPKNLLQLCHFFSRKQQVLNVYKFSKEALTLLLVLNACSISSSRFHTTAPLLDRHTHVLLRWVYLGEYRLIPPASVCGLVLCKQPLTLASQTCLIGYMLLKFCQVQRQFIMCMLVVKILWTKWLFQHWLCLQKNRSKVKHISLMLNSGQIKCIRTLLWCNVGCFCGCSVVIQFTCIIKLIQAGPFVVTGGMECDFWST